MNKSLVFRLLGRILLVEAAAQLLPVLVALIYREGDWLPLLGSALIAAAVGGLLQLIPNTGETLRAREGLATVALSWVAMSAFGALPFVLGGYVPSYTDAFFETASGFTTTGSSILRNLEALPKGILFWRSFTHWLGGMGVLVLSLAILPKMGARTLNLLKAESPGPTPSKLVPRIGNTARILYRIYLTMSVVMVMALLCCGLNLYDALIHTFGSAGTGGFSNYALSIGHFQSPAVELVIGTFTLLFGVNFSLYFFLIHKNGKWVLKNTELRAFIGIVVAAVLVIALNILPTHEDIWHALRAAYFQVSTIISTTGFCTEDFNLWPQLSRWVIVLLMFVGASAGSTGGGLKVVRLSMLGKSVWREVKRSINPRSVQTVKMDGRAVEEAVLAQVLVFAFAYVCLVLLGALLVSVDGFSLETNFTAALSAVSNIGPGLGDVGPLGGYAGFSVGSKWVLSFCMLAGRLEIYPMLMLFTLASWKRN